MRRTTLLLYLTNKLQSTFMSCERFIVIISPLRINEAVFCWSPVRLSVLIGNCSLFSAHLTNLTFRRFLPMSPRLVAKKLLNSWFSREGLEVQTLLFWPGCSEPHKPGLVDVSRWDTDQAETSLVLVSLVLISYLSLAVFRCDDWQRRPARDWSGPWYRGYIVAADTDVAHARRQRLHLQYFVLIYVFGETVETCHPSFLPPYWSRKLPLVAKTATPPRRLWVWHVLICGFTRRRHWAFHHQRCCQNNKLLRSAGAPASLRLNLLLFRTRI